MSDIPLQISSQLVNDVQSVISKADPRAHDPSATMQYLAAIIGIILGNRPATEEEKQAYIDQLSGFIKRVVDDVDGQRQEPAAEE
ncbi:hypothetical protein BOW53_06570 [Solemya pervernicosa gill symbiont]|uniref:Uncharacterized protein n=2 Tax=Gammaproteobacteria incertae sedis TaxID=118884 RepID=A0A1T2L755_9GAMM|nr:hypothetical protein [Candidatus Reidiella endopervernicosa]OOZ40776.1 hypothetical protein BOW53_06570 [Solemya pervernicosa gill symbiont]QKQ26388.1 hypothetical protein HUE57_08915 [Candidatus Reidiella endopervernicosa]